MTEIDQVRPHDKEAEEAVLGSILIDPDGMMLLGNTLSPKSFYLSGHQWIFAAAQELYQAKEPLDFITLSAKLRELDRLEPIGGEAELIRLINVVPTSINLLAYARIVKVRHLDRCLIDAAGKIATLGYTNGEAGEELNKLAEAQQIIVDMQQDDEGGLRPIKDIASNVIDDVQNEKIKGIPTGFIDIDRILGGGVNKGNLVVIASRPGMGKTSLLNSIALNASIGHGKRIGIFNLEMTGEELVMRMVSMESRINSQRLKKGELHENEWPSFMQAVGKVSSSQIFIDDMSMLDPAQLMAKALRMQMIHGLDMILVDYLQLMVINGFRGPRVEEVTRLSRGLKMVAKELNIPVIAASQLSRGVEQRQDKRPVLSDLRDSGSIEQDADIVMFIYRDEYYNPDTTERAGIAEVNIAKHRNGPTGIADLYWNGQTTAFRNLQRQEIDLNTGNVTVSEPTQARMTEQKYDVGGK